MFSPPDGPLGSSGSGASPSPPPEVVRVVVVVAQPEEPHEPHDQSPDVEDAEPDHEDPPLQCHLRAAEASARASAPSTVVAIATPRRKPERALRSSTAASTSARSNQRTSSSSSSPMRGSPRRPGRDEAEHQRGRERPRLGGDVARRADLDARLLAHLARDGLLEALARLDEPGQRGVAAAAARSAWRPSRTRSPSGHEHDHDRVGARVMLGAAVRAAAHEAGLADARSGRRRRSRSGGGGASSAARRRRRRARRPLAGRVAAASRRPVSCRCPAAASTANTGPAVVEAEQERLGAAGRRAGPAASPVVADVDAARARDDGARGRVRAPGGQPRRVAAVLGRAVERPAGEREAHTT